MTWLAANWRRALGIGNALLLLGLLVAVIWIGLRSGPSDERVSKPGASPARPDASQASRPATGAPQVTRVPVFTVASPYPAAVPITATQALLTGHVVDAVSKAPLPGAQLDIDQAGGKLTLHTDTAGRFVTAVETARPFSFTIDAAGHDGGAVFGKLCAGDRKDVVVALPPAGTAPAGPQAIQGSQC